jgi:hypothetical protein
VNALLRAKAEWELVNAQRFLSLILFLKAGAGLSLYLLWSALKFLGSAVLSRESFIKDQYLEMKNAKRFF